MEKVAVRVVWPRYPIVAGGKGEPIEKGQEKSATAPLKIKRDGAPSFKGNERWPVYITKGG